jgi:hypothetical protein
MYKKVALALALLSTSWISQANLIQNITGADMDGIKVTVTYGNGATSSQIWAATGPQSGMASWFNSSNNTNNGKGWSLTQNGDTIGENDPSVLPGYWTLTSVERNIKSLLIEGLYGNIVFDNLFGNANVNGSGAGREFTYTDNSVTAAFSDQYDNQADLYGSMLLTGTIGSNDYLLRSNTSMQFLIDTDEVPEPSTIFILMSGLLGLMVTRKKRAGK